MTWYNTYRWSNVYESNEAGNLLSRPITIRVPDLLPTSINAPASGTTQHDIDVSWTVNNQGNGKADWEWWDAWYLSSDDQFDDTDTLLGYINQVDGLAPGTSYNKEMSLRVPDVPPGNYYLLIATDWLYVSWYTGPHVTSLIYESNESSPTSTVKRVFGVVAVTKLGFRG